MTPSDHVLPVPSPDPPITADSPAPPGDAAPDPPPRRAPTVMRLLTLILAVGLAFLLASFPARNNDLWARLAAGRRLAAAEAVSGAGASDRAISPSWIYDLISYLIYQSLGGAGLVFAKALLAAALAVVLLRLCRAGPGWWAPALCTTLALLAAGARLLLQPATVSYLLLALTLLLLRRGPDPADRPRPPRPFWPLAALFVLWANVDSWFVCGLAVVGLTWLGEVLDFAVRPPAEGGLAERRRTLVAPAVGRAGALALLGAFCLLNPSHIYAFLPALELLGPAGAHGPAQAASPFRPDYLAAVGLNATGLAYFPLLGLSLLSFFLTLPRWHWRRFLPWAALALLSVLQARAVPLFAVAAGPYLAWNLQEFFARRPDLRPQALWRRGAVVAGRALAVALGLAFLICAWPGWLQAPPYGPRRWAVETSPSLERGAAVVRAWRRDGLLGPDARGLHLGPDSAQSFAWFCPEEKGLVDPRLASAFSGGPGGADDWAARLRASGVNHLIVYDSDRDRLFTVLDRLLADPRQWPLLYEDGDLAVFGWRDPETAAASDPFRGMELDLNRLAFHPAEDKKAPPAPPEQPAEDLSERGLWTDLSSSHLWDAFWKPAPPRPIDREEAMLRLLHAEALRRAVGPWQLAGWVGSQEAALVGGAAGWAGPADLYDARVRLTMVMTPPPPDDISLRSVPIPERWAVLFMKAYGFEQDDAPPALLYLAVRAARRAVAVNPDDAKAYEVLGESYVRLRHATRERAWVGRLPPLLQLRYAQASAAFNRAVELKPDYAEAHLQLGGLYQEMGYIDLALEHLRTYLKLAHEEGTPAGTGAAEFREQEARYREAVDNLAADVQKRNDAYTLQSGGATVLRRATVASEMGLAGKALDMLLKSDVSAFGKEGMVLELELLLQTGRPKDVTDWTGPDQQEVLGNPVMYHWLRARAMAAEGNYAQAEKECAAMTPSAGLDEPAPEAMTRQQQTAMVVGRRVLDEWPGPGPPYQLRWPFGRAEFHDSLANLSQDMRQDANTAVLWGLLALEQGEMDDAQFAFRKALDVWRDPATAAAGGGLDFQGRVIAQTCLEWLK